MDTPPDEYGLAKRALDGDVGALSHLAERLRAPLFAAAFGELHHYDDAQDAVAAALLRICRRIGTLRDPSQIRPWAAQVVRHEARRLRTTTPAPRLGTG